MKLRNAYDDFEVLMSYNKRFVNLHKRLPRKKEP